MFVSTQNSFVEALSPKVPVLEGEAFGRNLGLDEAMRWSLHEQDEWPCKSYRTGGFLSMSSPYMRTQQEISQLSSHQNPTRLASQPWTSSLHNCGKSISVIITHPHPVLCYSRMKWWDYISRQILALEFFPCFRQNNHHHLTEKKKKVHVLTPGTCVPGHVPKVD